MSLLKFLGARLAVGSVVTAFVAGLFWLSFRVTAWRCRRGIHDYEWGVGPCMDCGAANPEAGPA